MHYGPTNPVSEQEHASKYRIPGETFLDVCNRVSGVLGDGEQHRRELRQILLKMKFLPGGRIQRAIGSPLAVTPYNCLAGDTLIPTLEYGLAPIASIETATIIDGNGHPVRCSTAQFPAEQLLELTFTKYRRSLAVKATRNHRWIDRDGKSITTADLRVGGGLPHITPIKGVFKSEKEYFEGLAHGIIYGDGTDNNGSASIRVCADQDIIVPILEDAGFNKTYPPSCAGDPYMRLLGAGAIYKGLPEGKSYDYILGFVRGWFAADGCVTAQPEVILTGDRASGDWLKKYGPVIGWSVIGESLLSPTTNFGKRTRDTINYRIGRDSLTVDDFIIPHKAANFYPAVQDHWALKSIEEVDAEPVYCFAVPTTHSFMLSAGILTGNCFVSGTIADDSINIMDRAKEALLTMRTGGGIGYDFSTLRPRGAHIRSLNSESSGAVSFMHIYDSVCKTVRSAGGRRGAQMGVLRVDHPDILEFIHAKENSNSLTAFNISVGVTDKFMEAVVGRLPFDLIHNGITYQTVDAKSLWDTIMRTTWDWAEPGILFIDRINDMNNLWYCEKLEATNPCGEQPLPPYGACLLGSFNMTAYTTYYGAEDGSGFDMDGFKKDIHVIVRAMDKVVDEALYPLPQQEAEAKNKRRMGLGVTGMANALESIAPWVTYGNKNYLMFQDRILETLRDEAYRASAQLAAEKGAFPLYDATNYFSGQFIQDLPADVLELIYKNGIRNSHLTSIAPTGTISLTADNISSGLEPVFAHKQRRTIINEDGVSSRTVELEDYGVAKWGIKGKTAEEVTVDEHIDVLCAAQKYIDSAISKTCNVGDAVSFEQFKDIYMKAYQGGAKGCTTFRASGKRFGILQAITDTPEIEKPIACQYDPATGVRSCE